MNAFNFFLQEDGSISVILLGSHNRFIKATSKDVMGVDCEVEPEDFKERTHNDVTRGWNLGWLRMLHR